MDQQEKLTKPGTLSDADASVVKALAAPPLHVPGVHLHAEEGTSSLSPLSGHEPALQRYSFEGEIARGGMGAVFKGRDVDLGREVAVKVLLETHKGKTELLQRFVEEAQIAGQLQHPGIAPVYELGHFPDQRPFFTMKLVRGETLASLLKDLSQSDPESNVLHVGLHDHRARLLKIFEQVCQTLAYAHARRVIHRDLKPQNIMVGKFGEVQVMDWGLAKVLGEPEVKKPSIPSASASSVEVLKTEESVQTRRSVGETASLSETQPGSIMGTLSYMSPEQARGEVDQLDERCDVFGLGSILCEILTGQPAYVAENAPGILEKAEQADLVDAFQRLDRCGADRELITLAKQCLAADRNDRPRHAGVLTDALTAYLNNVQERLKQAELSAVEARTQATEQEKRRRITFRLAAAILITVLSGMAVSLWQMRRAMQAEEFALSERDQKDQQRIRAESNEKLAKENADKAIRERDRADQEKQVAQAVREFLQQNLLQKASIAEQANALLRSNAKAGAVKQDITIRELLDRAAIEFSPQTIDQKFPQQVQVQAEILETIGEAYEALGDEKKAIQYIKACWQVLEKQRGATHPATLAAMSELVFVCFSASQHAEACSVLASLVKRLNEVMELSQKESKPELALATLNAVVQLIERRLDMKRYSLPTIRFGIGDATLALLHLSQSIGTFEKFENATARLCGEDDLRTIYARLILGFGYHGTGQFRKAVDMYEKLHARAEVLFSKDDMRLAGGRIVLAIGYEALGIELEKRVRLKEQACETMIRVLGKDHPQTQACMENLAIGYYDLGKYDQLVPLFKEVYEFRKQRFAPDHPLFLQTKANLAAAYEIVGKIDLSIQLSEETLTFLREKYGTTHHLTMSSIRNLAVAYRSARRFQKAIALHEEALHLMTSQIGKTHPETVMQMLDLGETYLDAVMYDKAQSVMEETLKVCQAKYGPAHDLTLRSMNCLAVLYEEMGLVEKAQHFLVECLQLRRKHKGSNASDLLISINNLASFYESAGQFQKAGDLFDEALQLAKERYGENHQETHEYMRKRAVVSRKMGNTDQSIALLQQELSLRSRKEQQDKLETYLAKSQLGISYVEIGKNTEGIQLLESMYAHRHKYDALKTLHNPLIDAYTRTNQVEKLVKLVRNDLQDLSQGRPKEIQATADQLAGCCLALLQKKDFASAVTLAQRCLALRQELHQVNWKLYQAQAYVGMAALGQKNYAAAEASLLASHAGLMKMQGTIPVAGMKLLEEITGQLVLLYKTTGKLDEIARWQTVQEQLRKR